MTDRCHNQDMIYLARVRVIFLMISQVLSVEHWFCGIYLSLHTDNPAGRLLQVTHTVTQRSVIKYNPRRGPA